MRAAPILLVACAMAASCAPAAGPPATAPPSPAGVVALTPDVLHALFAAEWDDCLRERPTYASRLGDHRFDDRWPDVSPAGQERRAAHAREMLARLQAMDPRALPAEDRVSFVLFLRGFESTVEGLPLRLEHLAIDQNGGIQTADDLGSALPFASTRDYEAWIARLRALPAYADQTAELLREGVREHIVHPRVVMERVTAEIAKQIVDDPDGSPFFAPLRRMPSSIPLADRERLARAARAAIADGVVPAYRRFQGFFEREYLPACFSAVGAWQLPRGDDAYACLTRLHTTTGIRPQEAHDLGLREVARIRGEMLSLMQKWEKIGQLEIRRLRQETRTALGDRFDVRQFHDVVLRDGAIPLDLLTREVEAWISDVRADAGHPKN